MPRSIAPARPCSPPTAPAWPARPPTCARGCVHQDLTAAAGGQALGLAAAAMQSTLGFVPYDTQVRAAWLMLDGALVEMATGEGKTLGRRNGRRRRGVGRRAGACADRQRLPRGARPRCHGAMFDALGLRSASVTAPLSREARAQAYRSDIVYVTGREIVFDYLKDHLALGGERDPRLLRARALGGVRSGQPVLPGLHLAIVDEADSILLDEACIPFLLAAPGVPPDLAALEGARALADCLAEGDYALQPRRRDAQLTEAGRAAVARTLHAASPLWPARHAFELVRAALVANHCCAAIATMPSRAPAWRSSTRSPAASRTAASGPARSMPWSS